MSSVQRCAEEVAANLDGPIREMKAMLVEAEGDVERALITQALRQMETLKQQLLDLRPQKTPAE
jgi:uncharacterized protein YqfA (UPF0365 family)